MSWKNRARLKFWEVLELKALSEESQVSPEGDSMGTPAMLISDLEQPMGSVALGQTWCEHGFRAQQLGQCVAYIHTFLFFCKL